MSQEGNMRRVTAIKNGTVIDHIPAGKALSVLKMLGIAGDMSNPVSLVMNVPSKKMGGPDSRDNTALPTGWEEFSC